MGILKFLIFSIVDVEGETGSKTSQSKEFEVDEFTECSKLVFLETKMKRIWEVKLTDSFIKEKMQEMNIVETSRETYIKLAQNGLDANNFQVEILENKLDLVLKL